MMCTMTIMYSFGLFATLASAFVPGSDFSLAGTYPKSFIASQLNMATWSDSRAVKEYQDFLASGRQDIEQRPDLPSVIIKAADGDSEMADAIFKMGMGDDVVLLPGQDLPPQIDGFDAYPVYITIPPQQLKEFLKNLPSSLEQRRDDFVFISGGLKYGNIEKTLKDTGFCRDAQTQVLATGFKSKPYIQDISVKLGTSANGEEKIAGECVACGKWSGSVVERLGRSNVRCRSLFYREWRRLMWERNVYDAVFNLVGAVRTEPTTLCDVARYYGDEVSDLVWQISGILRGMKAITLTYGFEERMFGVAENTGSETQCRLIDDMFPFLFEDFQMATSLSEYLGYAQDERGLLKGVTLARKPANGNLIMRQGNLRADGVI